MESGVEKTMPDSRNPKANPLAVLREEFDNWAMLFDPDSGNTFGLNPVGVFIWKHLDGLHTTEEILKELRKKYENIPEKAEDHLKDFIQTLIKQGLAGHETQKK